MAVATIAMIGCKKDEPTTPSSNPSDNPTPTPTPSEDVPDGYVQILIQVPDGEECHGIYMKGTLNGTDWSGENTYIGLEEAGVEADKAIKFERIADKSDFFKANFKLGTGGLEGKICQKYPNDGSWQGQATKVSLIEDKTTMENAAAWKEGIGTDWPQLKIPAGTKPCVIALKIGGWQNSECVKANEAGKATWTLKLKTALPEGAKVGIAGVHIEGRGDWENDNPILMTKVDDLTYKLINNVGANCVYKYTLCFADEPGFADKHGHLIAGDKSDLSMPVSLAPVDEVDGWVDYDKHYTGEAFDPAKTKYSLIGTAVADWDTDVEFVYGADDGDYHVAEASNVAMKVGEFKVRTNKDWAQPNFGWGAVTITGDEANFGDAGNGNISCLADQTYSKVVFKFKWNGAQAIDRTLIFTK